MANRYYEQLQHPKWQEKRLRILERDGFSCRMCKSKESSLHVHHGYYEKGKAPWEYEDETLISVCDSCHRTVQAFMTELHRSLARLSIGSQAGLLGAAKVTGYITHDRDLPIGLRSCYEMEGALRWLGMDIDGAIDAADLYKNDQSSIALLSSRDLASLVVSREGSEQETHRSD